MLVGVLDRLLITMLFCKIISYLRNIPMKIENLEQPSNQNHSQPRKAMFLPQIILKTTIEKLQMLYKV